MTEATPDLLDKCLADMLAGRASPEECLASYPDQAQELRGLLAVAASIERPRPISTDPVFRRRGRAALLQAIADGRQEAPSRRLRWPDQWGALLGLWWPRPPAGANRFALRPALAVALAILLTLITGTGAIQAAQDALPGQPLYPVKATVEGLQTTLAWDDEARAQVYLARADRRLAEMSLALQSGQLGAAAIAARAFAMELEEADKYIASAASAGKDVETVTALAASNAARQGTELDIVREIAPMEIQPELERAASAADRQLALVRGTPTGPSSATPGRTGRSEPDPTIVATATPLPATTVISAMAPITPTATSTAVPTTTVGISNTLPASLTQAISDVQALADDVEMAGQSYRGLAAKLEAAQAALERGHTKTAENILNAFGHQLEAFRHSGHISSASYDRLLADYTGLLQSLHAASGASFADDDNDEPEEHRGGPKPEDRDSPAKTAGTEGHERGQPAEDAEKHDRAEDQDSAPQNKDKPEKAEKQEAAGAQGQNPQDKAEDRGSKPKEDERPRGSDDGSKANSGPVRQNDKDSDKGKEKDKKDSSSGRR